MITFKQITFGSDCTGLYDVAISKPMTVKEFVDELLTDYPFEWGYIGIYEQREVFGNPKCEYRYGKLLSSLPAEYLDKEIKEVNGHGGWSRSDFTLKLQE